MEIIQSGQERAFPFRKPSRVHKFTGREEELARLVDELLPGNLITLSGPGGIGKTALAAQAIWRIAPGDTLPERFPEGILFYSFYNNPQVAIACEDIALVYGEEIQPSPHEAAQRALAGRKALLLLDGAEQADDLPKLLEMCASCGVLITTRERRDAPAGRLELEPLPLDKALELYQVWAGSAAGDKQSGERICAQLGRLPLAVRQAGRYLAVSGQAVEEYLAWLEKSPLVALDQGKLWQEIVPHLLRKSLAHMSENARAIWGVAGVLALAPFELECVMAALGLKKEALLKAVGELEDYGLLLGSQAGDQTSGYVLSHADIHIFARHELPVEMECIVRLAGYYEGFVRRERGQGAVGFARLEGERVHALRVLRACARREAWEAGLDLAWALDDYLDQSGHWTEWRIALELARTCTRGLQDRRSEGLILSNQANVIADTGESRHAIEVYEQHLQTAREIRDRQGEGSALDNLGSAYAELGETQRAIDYYKQALAIDREIGDRRGEGSVLSNLGSAYADLGKTRWAIKYYKQAQAIHREIGDRRGEAAALGNLGNVYAEQGNIRRAIGFYEQALVIQREIGDRWGEGNALGSLGVAYADLGEIRQAIELHEQHLQIAREIENWRGVGNALGNLGNAYADLGESRRSIEYYEQLLQTAREIGDRRGEGKALGSLANAYAGLGESWQAIDLYEQALVVERETGDRRGEGIALANFGMACYNLDELDKARLLWQEALEIFSTIESPNAVQVQEWLEELDQK